MTSRIAGLPMYDWPEVQSDVDELWRHINRAATAQGVDTPGELVRPAELVTLWRDPKMILGQVCSLNPVRDGLGETEVIGTIAYEPPPGLPPMDAGTYASVIVCRADDERRPADPFGLGVGRASDAIEAFRGASVAANGTDSQSGYWSLGHFVREIDDTTPVFGAVRFTGAHRTSVTDVAAGRCDIAAIDLHSWRLACEYESAAASQLAIVGVTDPTPGVVCVVSWELAQHRAALDAALNEAVSDFVTTDSAKRLHIVGYSSRHLDEFDVVADRVEDAARRRWHE